MRRSQDAGAISPRLVLAVAFGCLLAGSFCPAAADAQQASPTSGNTNRAVPARVLRTVVARPGEPPAGGAATNVTAQLAIPPVPVATGSTNATNAGISSSDPRVRELLKLQFDRRPASVLKSMARKAEGDKAFTNDLERFQADVTTSDWPAVRKFLATLSEKQLPPVYKALITGLGRPPPTSSATPPSAEPPDPGAPQPAPAQRAIDPVLLPEDILGLADAKPADLDDADLDALGKLLTRALTKGAVIEPFLARLEAGTERLGGNDAQNRRNAANLLIAAGRMTDAAAFLPGFDASKEKNDWAALDLRARLLLAEGQEKQDASALRGSWELTQNILADKSAPATNREAALQRAVELMPLLTKELGRDWLRQNFATTPGEARGDARPSEAMSILAAVGTVVSQGANERDLEKRRRNLDLQRRVVDELLAAAGPQTDSWQPALTVVALGWLQEADRAKARLRPRTMNQQIVDFDAFGNPIYSYYSPYDSPGYPGAPQADGQALTIDQVLPAAPGETWLAAMEKSVALRVRATMADLHIKLEQEEKALPWIESLAADQPKAAVTLANDLLKSWTLTKDPNRDSRRNQRIYYGPYGNSYSQGIPITRAVQVRNLQQLAEVLARLRKLGPLDEKAVVSAFAASHSQAEVFRVSDIEKVLGPPDELKVDTLAELLQAMRERLARQWRQPAVQQQAKTKRTDKDIAAELARGYELVLGLTERAVARRPNEWRLWTVRGATLFDFAEYEYGREVALALYTEKRDQAFAMFEKAAKLYAAQVGTLSEKEQTPIVYQQWFNATLGASDLAFLTRQQKIDTNRIDFIRAAILALPTDMVDRHLGLLGKAFVDSITALPPELKPRYLKAGLRLVGDHESAEPARKQVAYYDGLLQEIEFHARVDGNVAVGHGRPFGLQLCVRHSDAVGRESGGFSKYLQNQQGMQYYYNPYGGSPVNYRDDLEKKIRETLHDGFEILSITWHDDKVVPRGYGRPEWRETPLAYILLKAKDAAADRIPPMQLDLDFLDKRGKVVLPVESPIVFIDARSEKPPLRALADLAITQILDDRDRKSGKLTLEVKATARGIIPDLEDLLNLNLPGFMIEKPTDHGLAVTKLDTEADAIAPVCERNWLLNLLPISGADAPKMFAFPKPKLPADEVAYKHYVDADLVAVKETLALAGLPLEPKNSWGWVWAGIVFVVCGVGLYILLRPSTRAAAEQAAAYALPAHITPFSVLSLLRSMEQDPRLDLHADRRAELATTIHELERRYFGPGADTDGEADLERLARDWVTRAS
jgi:hypothetical protein